MALPILRLRCSGHQGEQFVQGEGRNNGEGEDEGYGVEGEGCEGFRARRIAVTIPGHHTIIVAFVRGDHGELSSGPIQDPESHRIEELLLMVLVCCCSCCDGWLLDLGSVLARVIALSPRDTLANLPWPGGVRGKRGIDVIEVEIDGSSL